MNDFERGNESHPTTTSRLHHKIRRQLKEYKMYSLGSTLEDQHTLYRPPPNKYLLMG